MKTILKNTHRYRKYPSVAALVGLLLMGGACSTEEPLPGTGDEMPVAFTASINGAVPSTAPRTRTVIGADGNAEWAEGDAVGIFMSNDNRTTIFSGGENIRYTVDPATGNLTAAESRLYYPKNENVLFTAYYPYGKSNITDDHMYNVSVADQSDPASLDLLWASTPVISRPSKEPVELKFRHVLGKMQADIILGAGMEGLTAADITDVKITGMPTTSQTDLIEGTLFNCADVLDITLRRENSPSQGVTATFTALLIPHMNPANGGEFSDRRIVVTVDGIEYTGTIPDTDDVAKNILHTYPVTVSRTGITVGTPDITKWELVEHNPATAEPFYTVTFDANGGTGTPPAPLEVVGGNMISMPTPTQIIPPPGKTFTAWNLKADGSGDVYTENAFFWPLVNTTFYAVWGR